VVAAPHLVVAWTQVAPTDDSNLRLVTRAVEHLGMPADDLTLARHCPRCGSDRHGRPYVVDRPDLAVSLTSVSEVSGASGASGATGVAVSRGLPVGVDVERIDEDRFARLGDVLLHPAEHVDGTAGLARTWVRKESLLKALGVGFGTDPRTVRLSPPTEPPVLLSSLPDGRDAGAWIFDLTLPPPLVGSVAVLSDRRPEVRTTEAASGEPSP
jgi:4'-phosphopantetheinyl transferase